MKYTKCLLRWPKILLFSGISASVLLWRRHLFKKWKDRKHLYAQMLQFTDWHFRLAQKLQSWVVMGGRNRHNARSSTSEKFSRAHQLVTSNKFSSEGTVIGLYMTHESYLHCTTFWEIIIFQYLYLFANQNAKI